MQPQSAHRPSAVNRCAVTGWQRRRTKPLVLYEIVGERGTCKDPCQRQKVPYDHTEKLHTHSPANPPQLATPGNCVLSNLQHHECFAVLGGAKAREQTTLKGLPYARSHY
jgi:hypothetical protein